MKISLMIGGAFLIICAIIGHNSIPYIISQANVISSTPDGNVVCGMNVGNSCLALSFAETTFEFGTLGLGVAGILLVGYGVLTHARKEEDLQTTNSGNSAIKILQHMLS